MGIENMDRFTGDAAAGALGLGTGMMMGSVLGVNPWIYGGGLAAASVGAKELVHHLNKGKEMAPAITPSVSTSQLAHATPQGMRDMGEVGMMDDLRGMYSTPYPAEEQSRQIAQALGTRPDVVQVDPSRSMVRKVASVVDIRSLEVV